MNSRFKLCKCLVLSTLFLLSTQPYAEQQKSSSVLPETKAQWRSITNRDIEAAYQLSALNHPGMFDVNNPAFPTLLNQARKEALALSDKASGPLAYAAAIARFRAELQDGHAGTIASLPADLRPEYRWPGFSIVWRGDSLKVYYSETKNIEKGDRISSCDGQSIDTLMRERVFMFEGNVEQPGHWWSQGPRLLVDDGNPFLTPLETCQFVKPSGTIYSAPLVWSVRPEDINTHLKYAYNGDKLAIDLTWPEESIAWIAMPTFTPNSEQTSDYERLFGKLKKQHEQLLNARTVVLDLRHNQGGSSYWSNRIARELWGVLQVKRAIQNYSANTEVWWRASSENAQYVESIKEVVKNQKEVHEMFMDVASGMHVSLSAGKPFYVEQNNEPEQYINEIPSSNFKSNVLVIVPSQCGSACLDAIDTFKLFSNTKLFGAPSSSDSTYMEVRLEDLPSGLGQVIIPIKVYVNRPRGNGYFYQPDIPYNELEWTTGLLLEHIRKL